MSLGNQEYSEINSAQYRGPRFVPTAREHAARPEHAEIRKIAEDILGAMKYSFCAAVANVDVRVDERSLEAGFRKLLSDLSQKQVEATRQRARALISADDLVREHVFGRAGHRSADEHLSSGFENYLEAMGAPAVDQSLLGIRESELRVPLRAIEETASGFSIRKSDGSTLTLNEVETQFSLVQQFMAESGIEDAGPMEDWSGKGFKEFVSGKVTLPPGAFPPHDSLQLYVDFLQCKKETFALIDLHPGDEIKLAGIAINNLGQTSKIHNRLVGKGFKDHTVKYLPDIAFAKFDLSDGDLWPKLFNVVFILSEDDGGKLGDMFSDWYEENQKLISSSVKKAIGDLAGAWLGKTLGALVGEVAAWLVGKFFDFINFLLGDDYFPPRLAQLEVPNPISFFTGSDGAWGAMRSETRILHFFGHGGHYRMGYHWEYSSG